MAIKRPKVIVYHGNLDGQPPHSSDKWKSRPNYGFHAGTIESALERLAYLQSEREQDWDTGEYGSDTEPKRDVYLHAYEIPGNSISLATYEDPHSSGYGDPYFSEIPEDYVETMQVKETRRDKVNKYINRWEDAGSLSYVIPHNLVRPGVVRYLNTQQFNIHPDDYLLERDNLLKNTKRRGR